MRPLVGQHCFQKEDVEKSYQRKKEEDVERDGLNRISENFSETKETYMHSIYKKGSVL
jgi:hypothetical protein